jgi:hypothetical protein
VWLPGGKAAPDGLGQRAGGHRERIAEGSTRPDVGSVTGKEPPLPWGYGGSPCPHLTTLVNPTKRKRALEGRKERSDGRKQVAEGNTQG